MFLSPRFLNSSRARYRAGPPVTEQAGRCTPHRTADDDFGVYYEYLTSALKGAARENWEALMANPSFTCQSDFARKFVAEGKAEDKAESILSVLAHRRLDVSDDLEARITACTGIDRLGT